MQLLFAFLYSSIACGWEIAQKDVEMPQICSWPWEAHDMDVVYPNVTAGSFPVVAYAHGWKAGGDRVDADLRELFALLASAGYVVVAPKAPYDHLATSWCMSQYKDMYSAIEWAMTAPETKDLVNRSIPAGIIGHSMGGRSTSIAATMKDKPESLNIGAAVLMHPACGVMACADPQQIVVPSMLIAGQNDTEVMPSDVQSLYEKVNGVPKAYVEAKGVQHTDPETYHQPNKDGIWGTPPRIENHYVLAWFNCFLKKNSTACALAECHESQSTSPTSACKYERMPEGKTLFV